MSNPNIRQEADPRIYGAQIGFLLFCFSIGTLK